VSVELHFFAWIHNAGEWIDTLGKAIAALATVVLGAWVWFKHLQGRVYRPRLRLNTKAERLSCGAFEYLFVRCELENVGLARVKIAHDGCIGRIYAHQLPRIVARPLEPRWQKLISIDLFAGCDWVEPRGLVVHEQMIALPPAADQFLKVWTHVESKKVAWNASVIVSRPRRAEPKHSGSPEG
jgi:hypothetical protein